MKKLIKATLTLGLLSAVATTGAAMAAPLSPLSQMPSHSKPAQGTMTAQHTKPTNDHSIQTHKNKTKTKETKKHHTQSSLKPMTNTTK